MTPLTIRGIHARDPNARSLEIRGTRATLTSADTDNCCKVINNKLRAFMNYISRFMRTGLRRLFQLRGI